MLHITICFIVKRFNQRLLINLHEDNRNVVIRQFFYCFKKEKTLKCFREIHSFFKIDLT